MDKATISDIVPMDTSKIARVAGWGNGDNVNNRRHALKRLSAIVQDQQTCSRLLGRNLPRDDTFCVRYLWAGRKNYVNTAGLSTVRLRLVIFLLSKI